MLVVIDTNVLMDAMKADGALDVASVELLAAKALLARLLDDDDLWLAYSKKMLPEWTQKKLFEEDMVLRILHDKGKLTLLKAHHLNKGQRAALGPHVAHDDQIFVLTAAAIPQKRKPCVTRDPRTTKPASRKYVKAEFGVAVLLASEFSA